MGKKKEKQYNDADVLKIFLFTFEEYLKFQVFFTNTAKLQDGRFDIEYVSLQTRLMLIRKYETKSEPIYLRTVLEAVDRLYPEQATNISALVLQIDEIENNPLELYLCDGTKRNLHEAIEDVIYGMYLHADKSRIESIVKTNMETYLYVVRKYVILWEKVLNESYTLINGLIKDKYSFEASEKASIIFLGNDPTQGQNIKSVPYWSNLRGKDAQTNEIELILNDLSIEEKQILKLITSFLEELSKPNYSIEKLKRMTHPLTRFYWKDFSSIHEEISHVELGCSTKVRFNDSHDIAYVALFNKFDPDGMFIINQPHYSTDIACIYVKKEKGRNDWKVVSLNIEPDKLIKTVTLDPSVLLKKIFTVVQKKKKQ